MSPECLRVMGLVWSHFQPPEDLNVWQWAEKNVILSSRVTPNPGPYRTTSCPYVRGPQEDFTNPNVHTMVWCWASRNSKTETAMNCVRYSIAKDPQALMIAMPTSILGRSFSETRLQPSIDDCPVLAAEKPADLDKYKLMEMHFKRCSLWVVGANSPATLKGRGVTVLFADEIDTWPKATSRETGALEQVLERTKDRWNRKHILTSTPTVEDGQIWKEFKKGDQRYYFVPCPHCGHFQTLKLKGLQGFEDAKLPDDTYDMSKLPRVVYYECEKCEQKILDKHKSIMLEKGEWRATTMAEEPGRRSYHLSSLYPEWIPFATVASMFLQSKASPEDLQRFVNSWLAEPFYLAGNVADQEARLLSLRDQECGIEVKEGYRPLITADVQQDRMYAVVRAHAANRDSELLEHCVVPGFEELVVVAQKFKCVVGFIDAGFRQQMILEFCAKNPGWIPTIGSSGLLAMIRWIKMPIDGGLFKGRVVNSLRFRPDDFKEQFYERVTLRKGASWKLPGEVSKEYQKQMVGEVRHERKGPRGRRIIEWIRRGANHYFDCEVLQLAGFEAVRAFAFDTAPQVGRPATQPREEEDFRRERDNLDGVLDGVPQIEWR